MTDEPRYLPLMDANENPAAETLTILAAHVPTESDVASLVHHLELRLVGAPVWRMDDTVTVEVSDASALPEVTCRTVEGRRLAVRREGARLAAMMADDSCW